METIPKQPLETARPTPSQILEQLERILASQPFRTSKRCSDLLRHVVRASSEGRLDSLKERTLGIAVFERDPDYDTNQDPVVRNTAGQVRKRLAQYYLEPGHEAELRIDLPSGAYVPLIQKPAARAPEVVEIAPKREPEGPVTTTEARRKRGWLWVAAAVGLLCAAAGALAWWNRPDNVKLFWAPLLKEAGPVVLCVGQGHTYHLKGPYDHFFEPEYEASEPLPATVPFNDLVPTWDKTIGIHDAQSLVRLAVLFAGFGKAVEFRPGRSTSLGDLRGKSTVLIGAFNNSWTLSLTGESRFYFDEQADGRVHWVRDRKHPENKAWEVREDQQTQDFDDYAIVSRVFNPTTEQTVVVAAGIKGGGTAAAGEFLTNAGYLGPALAGAPKRWATKNVQFVLKARLLGGMAGPPRVIAESYW